LVCLNGITFQVGGLKTFFLNSKDGRKPLKLETLKALLPTDKEAPKIEQEAKEVKDDKDDKPTEQTKLDDDKEVEKHIIEDDSGSLFEADLHHDEGNHRRASAVQTDYCGGFKRSPICNIL